MIHRIITISIVALLSGCIVAPTPYYVTPVYSTVYAAPVYYNPPTAVYPTVYTAPGYYTPDTIVYPNTESAYLFDMTVGAFFFWAGGYRHYMPHGWSYRTYGVPHGYFRGERHR